MAALSGAPHQWVLIGLTTGAEVYGSLPQAAVGQLGDYLNAELSLVIPLTRARTEDVAGGNEVPSLDVVRQHITYVQPWAAVGASGAVPVHAPRGWQRADVTLVLRTRVSISGTASLPPGVELAAFLARPMEHFVPFDRASLTAPGASSRAAIGVLVNKQHVMLARRHAEGH